MIKIKEQLLALLRFLRLLDADSTLSLTSVALCVMLYRVATANELSMTELGAFLAAVANYAGKKALRNAAAGDETTETLADLGTQLQAMKTELQVVSNRTNPRNSRPL